MVSVLLQDGRPLEERWRMAELMTTEHTDHDAPNQEALLLSEAASLLSRSLDPDTNIPAVLRLLSQLVGLNRGRVVLPDDSDDSCLRIRYAYGLRPEERTRGTYRLGEGITGRVMQSAGPCIVQDVDSDADYLFRAVDRPTLPDETVCFIAVPIMLDGTAMGVLGCHRLRNRPRPFEADIHLLRILAAMIGQTLRIQTLIRQHTAWLEDRNQSLRSALQRHGGQHGVLGESPMLREALDEAIQIAGSDATVMLLGESGTGKEKFARLIHTHSGRHEKPFICINCAAIPAQLLEAELFGHERGAFTGAVRGRAGKVEMAQGGTLFLDEIGDLGLELQAKLLRLLQERTVQRVGGDRDIPVDIRVITATHQDLQVAVNEGRFRLDLFYRLNVIPLRLPALRERTGDVVLLARHFLDRFNHQHRRNLNIGAGVLNRLQSYPWPGNIRQLENVLERAVLTARGHAITGEEIAHILREESLITERGKVAGLAEAIPPAPVAGHNAAMAGRPYQRVSETDVDRVMAALRQCRGNKTEAARLLGMSPRQLYYRMDKLGLRAPNQRNTGD